MKAFVRTISQDQRVELVEMPIPDIGNDEILVCSNCRKDGFRMYACLRPQKEGDTLCIAGASGAIGTFVIQLAAGQGIVVIGSAS